MRSDASASDAPGAELLELAAMAARLGTQDLREALQSVTDAGVNLTGAEYGAFFYSGEDEQGERLDLYVLSGAAAGAFPDEGGCPEFRGTWVAIWCERYAAAPTVSGVWAVVSG